MSAVSAIEQLVAQRDQQWVNLSEQALYNRMKLVWEREDYWDGFFSALSAGHLKASGWHIPFEQRWNYNPAPSRVDGVLVCKDTCTTQSCRDSCGGSAGWWYYLFSCEGYSETCGDYSHQTEMVCYQGLDGAYNCGFVLPDQNADGEGHGSRDFSELWDHENRELSFARVILHLALSHPVVISVPLYASWWTSTANMGIAPMPGGAGDVYRGDHAMHVLGYVDNDQLPTIAPSVPDGAGGGYFIVKNSWGNCFGDGGYVYMPYDYIRGYAYDVVAYLQLQ
jgi:hypothetical protein